MADYIDRTKIKYEIVENVNSTGRTKHMVERSKIEAMSSADVIKQKHGHWNRENSDYDCSNCGNSLSNIMDADSYYAIGFDGVPYCPYCGAKMDEVTKDV